MPQIAIARAAAAVVVEGRAVVIAIPPVREGATMNEDYLDLDFIYSEGEEWILIEQLFK